MRELGGISVKLSRGSFTLRADNTALADLEDLYDKPFEVIAGELLGNMKIRELCKVAAVFAKAETPSVTAEEILKAAPILEDLRALRTGIQEALFAALPPKKDKGEATDGEGGGDAPQRPFGNG